MIHGQRSMTCWKCRQENKKPDQPHGNADGLGTEQRVLLCAGADPGCAAAWARSSPANLEPAAISFTTTASPCILIWVGADTALLSPFDCACCLANREKHRHFRLRIPERSEPAPECNCHVAAAGCARRRRRFVSHPRTVPGLLATDVCLRCAQRVRAGLPPRELCSACDGRIVRGGDGPGQAARIRSWRCAVLRGPAQPELDDL